MTTNTLRIASTARTTASTTRGKANPRRTTIRGTWIVVAVTIGAYLVRGRRGLLWAQRALGGTLVVLMSACASNPTAPLSIPADSASIIGEPASPQASIR